MDNYIKIKKQISNKILVKIDNLKYMQNLRDGIELYNEKSIEEFIDSLRMYILLNDIDLKIKKFIVFWINYIIQNLGNKVNREIKEKINDIIITLDI